MKEEVVKIIISLFLTQRLVKIIPQQNHLEPNDLLVYLTKAKNYILTHSLIIIFFSNNFLIYASMIININNINY